MHNDKELAHDYGLDYSDYGTRYQDMDLLDFPSIDRFAEKYPWQSPYVYAARNPVKYIDVNGDFLWGIIIGIAADLAGQAAQNKLSGKGAFEDISYSSLLISGVSGFFDGGSSSIAKTVAINSVEAVAQQVISDDGININAENLDPIQFVSDVGFSLLGSKVKSFDDANIKAKEGILDTKERVLANTPDRKGRIDGVTEAELNLNAARNTNQLVGSLTTEMLQNTSDKIRSTITIGNYSVNIERPIITMTQDNTRTKRFIIPATIKPYVSNQ